MPLRVKSLCLLFFLVSLLTACTTADEQEKESSSYQQILTSADQTRLLEASEIAFAWSEMQDASLPTIVIDPEEKMQTMHGFGFTLTGGSAMLLAQMNPAKRASLLNEIFGREENGIGANYLRLSVGSSDLDPEVYSYNDLPPGETDVDMTQFSIAHEQEFLLPVLKEILAISPAIKILGSPWSPPVWMKDNNSSIGGSLLPEYYPSYATYLVKYVEAMAAEGIRIDALTVQNEPLHPGNNPSLLMLAEEQKRFVRDHLGPAFAKTSLGTKLIIYDHNCDKPNYPLAILADPAANAFIDGSAFHLYAGDISAMSEVHEAYPDKHLYFTEQYTNTNGAFAGDFMWHTKSLHIEAPRNWAKNVLEWNLASDPTASIHTPGGCTVCLGAITIDADSITRNAAYYSVAHSSKWVPDGSVRIASTLPEGLSNVAYLTASGKTVLLAINEEESDKDFQVSMYDKTLTLHLPARTVGTYTF